MMHPNSPIRLSRRFFRQIPVPVAEEDQQPEIRSAIFPPHSHILWLPVLSPLYSRVACLLIYMHTTLFSSLHGQYLCSPFHLRGSILVPAKQKQNGSFIFCFLSLQEVSCDAMSSFLVSTYLLARSLDTAPPCLLSLQVLPPDLHASKLLCHRGQCEYLY